MENEERQLSSEELQELLAEVEREHKTIRKTNNNRKKKPKVRIDMIIAVVVAIALLVGVISLVAHFVKSPNTKSPKTKAENPLEEEKYPEISDVVKNYLDAYLLPDPVQRHQILAQYVDNMGDIDESDIAQNQYITEYSDIECYTKKGPYDNTYVVYAYYHITLKNIATTVPGITTLYVIRDTNTGDVYIHNGVSTDISEYIAEVSKDQDVLDLFDEVNKEYKDALESDKQLKEFFEKLESKSKETTAAATTAPATTAAK